MPATAPTNTATTHLHAGALPCFVLPCVGFCAAASCPSALACLCVQYGADAACGLPRRGARRRAEVTRTGTDVRERAPAEVRVLPRGLNPGAGLGVPEEQEAEQAAGSTANEWVERGRVGLVESRLHLSVN